MTNQPLYPLHFAPIFQYRLWGGRDLQTWMQTPLPGDGPIGEAWVLSDRDDHASLVAEGPLKGMSITALMERRKTEILGDLAPAFDRFPLLLKFLDVQKMLSVQVHPPDDRQDLIPKGDSGKTEAWVVLETRPGSRIYAGLKSGANADTLRTLTTATADDLLASFTPEQGQGVLIQAGTVHSLGDGVMVFEVQENSDVTFRLYDWDHVDAKTGKPRDLQVDQAIACIDFKQGRVQPVSPALESQVAVKCEHLFEDSHFSLRRLSGDSPFDVGVPGAMRVLVCADGQGSLESAGVRHPVKRSDVFLLPAALDACRFHPQGAVALFEISVPRPPQ